MNYSRHNSQSCDLKKMYIQKFKFALLDWLNITDCMLNNTLQKWQKNEPTRKKIQRQFYYEKNKRLFYYQYYLCNLTLY
jgi:hypothetical protein